MIANDKQSPLEVAVKMITAPVWLPIYFAYAGCRRLAEARTDRKAKPETAELKPVWVPEDRHGEGGVCRAPRGRQARLKRRAR
jgi:hypothetical protein